MALFGTKLQKQKEMVNNGTFQGNDGPSGHCPGKNDKEKTGQNGTFNVKSGKL